MAYLAYRNSIWKITSFLLICITINAVFATLAFAVDMGSRFPYEAAPNQKQVTESDLHRVPRVEFTNDIATGSFSFKETDYEGEGQFPLKLIRHLNSLAYPFPFAGLSFVVHNYASYVYADIGYGCGKPCMHVITEGKDIQFDKTTSVHDKNNTLRFSVIF